MGDIILPGVHGYGTKGYTPTSEGYRAAAQDLVATINEGGHVDRSNSEVSRVLNYFGAASVEDLRVKFRGW